MRIRDLAQSRIGYGYRRLHILLMREGVKVNMKRVYRLYSEEGLVIRNKKKRRHKSGSKRSETPKPQAPNNQWSMDFMADQLACGGRIRLLTLVDNFSRESPGICVDYQLKSQNVIDMLDRCIARNGKPEVINVDNGSEFTSKALDVWAYQHGIKLNFSRPGKPTDNSYIESFNGRLRQERLNQHWFSTLDEAKKTVEAWRIEYNEIRPHSSLGNKSPLEFLQKICSNNEIDQKVKN